MPKLRHLALATKDPEKTAEFYKTAFGFKEIRKVTSDIAHGYHAQYRHPEFHGLRPVGQGARLRGVASLRRSGRRRRRDDPEARGNGRGLLHAAAEESGRIGLLRGEVPRARRGGVRHCEQGMAGRRAASEEGEGDGRRVAKKWYLCCRSRVLLSLPVRTCVTPRPFIREMIKVRVPISHALHILTSA